MFLTKAEPLLLTLLCSTLCVSAAAVVPVEDVPEERAAAAAAVEVGEEAAGPAAPEEGRVQEERAGPSVPDAPAKKDLLKDITPALLAETSSSDCPQGFHQYKNKCFLLVNLTYNWHNAEFLCENLGFSLASVHSIWEYSFLQELTRNAGVSTAWLGGYRFESYWRWEDGTPFDYKNWYSHSSSSSSYSCLHMSSQSYQGWSNTVCSSSRPFICSFQLTC